MGLTIHYDLSLPGKTPMAKVREIVERLRQAALDLPVASVSDNLVELKEKDCGESRIAELRASKNPEERGLLSLLTRSARLVGFKYDAYGRSRQAALTEAEQVVRVQARRLICFTIDPGPDCEYAIFGMAQYPKVIFVKGRSDFDDHCFRIPVENADQWIWHGFCKTQYASGSKAGGIENFLRCHLSLVAVLDAAKDMGFGVEVSDEGGFWESRDIAALCREVEDMNTHVAGLVGMLKDATENAGDAAFTSPILGNPEFERLEAKGREKIDPKLAELIMELARKSRKQE